MPKEFKLLISRNTPGTVWDINDLLKEFEKELLAREKINEHLLCERDYNNECTSQTLLNNSREKNKRREFPNNSYNKRRETPQMCVFCRRNHASKNCGIITKPEVRKNILQREKRCFVCMATSHQANNCRKNWKCFKCGGRHNFAICTFKKEENKDDSKTPQNNTQTNIQNPPEETSSNISLSKFNTVLLAKFPGAVNWPREGKIFKMVA